MAGPQAGETRLVEHVARGRRDVRQRSNLVGIAGDGGDACGRGETVPCDLGDLGDLEPGPTRGAGDRDFRDQLLIVPQSY